MAKAKSAIPEGLHTVTPMLTLNNASDTIAWYTRALGAKEISRATGPDGKILHAQLQIGNSHVMVHDVMGTKGPREYGGSPLSLWIYVEDADQLFNRAVNAGARVDPGPMGRMADQFWGDRCGTLTDPEGYQWTIATRKEDLTREEMQQRQDEWIRQMQAQGQKQPAHA
jgi:PhnB protein